MDAFTNAILDWYTFIGSQLFLVAAGYIFRDVIGGGVKKVEGEVTK
ncbi:MAG: hypothetical protein AAFY08_13050 [Planctomycetota bacterium]